MHLAVADGGEFGAVRFLALAVMVFLLAAPAAAETGEVDLRALVVAGDIAPVEAALKAAEAADQASGGEPDAERALFSLFTDTDPGIADLTERWLATEPGSALAMTARGWHLYALGWNARGTATANNVFPDAMRILMQDHAQAFDLANRAIAADQGLIAASDLMLELTTTLGNPEIIPVELERVMTLHPNRGSLMRVMRSFAPQWGGSPAQVKLLCERYAPLITGVAGYDARVCAIDAVYWGGFWNGDQHDEAHQLLQLIPNPILDYARLQDALAGLGPPQQRVKLLEDIKSKRDLTRSEAIALDMALTEAGPTPQVDLQTEWKIAIANALDWNRNAADHDPYDPEIVTAYVGTALDAEQNLGIKPDVDDLIRRLQRLLARLPYSAEAWGFLGDLMRRGTALGTVDLDMIAKVEPYDVNAAVYSNYSHSAVKSLIWTKFWAIIDVRNISKTRDISGLTKAERARYDAVVFCPMIRQMTILSIVCRNQGIPDDQCDGFPTKPERVLDRLRAVVAEGSCREEVERDPATLAYSPITIDFAAAP